MTVDTIAAAVEVVESRGEWWARSTSGNRGVMQVAPQWARVPAAQLWLPDVNRREGRRLLVYWYGKARGDWWNALAAYRCGWGGLSGKCGTGYARRVVAVAKRAAAQ